MIVTGAAASTSPADDERWMRLALEQARSAAAAGEVPVGAVLVREGRLLATGRNNPVAGHDPSAHAEIMALRAGAQALDNYRLQGCTLYVTLEPCAMCAGAMLHARLARVVFGAADARTGAAGSVINLFAQPALNHQTAVQGGVLADDSAALLQAFFRPRRVNPAPLREDALRTPQARFAALTDMPDWPSRHVQHLPALGGLRLHYWLVPPQGSDAPPPHDVPDLARARVLLCLHDKGQWAYAFAHTARAASRAGWHVLLPDLIGFGQSDKPKKADWHVPRAASKDASTPHLVVLQQWLQWLGVRQLAVCGVGQGAALGDALCAAWSSAQWLPVPEGLAQWLALDAPVQQNRAHAAWQAPFADAGHMAALRGPDWA